MPGEPGPPGEVTGGEISVLKGPDGELGMRGQEGEDGGVGIPGPDGNNVSTYRPTEKSAYSLTIFFISHPKHMLWVLKRIVSMRRFF